jgi:hypothetical protein
MYGNDETEAQMVVSASSLSQAKKEKSEAERRQT